MKKCSELKAEKPSKKLKRTRVSESVSVLLSRINHRDWLEFATEVHKV